MKQRQALGDGLQVDRPVEGGIAAAEVVTDLGAPNLSISAGLDYPGVGPEHAILHDTGRAEYLSITDSEAMEAFSLLSKSEGIIPAIETAHALAGAIKVGKELGPNAILLINLSGRGDKDVQTAAKYFGIQLD